MHIASFTEVVNRRLCDSIPSLYVERGEGLECSLACEKLEATLRVLDPSHTKEPDEEVEAVHEKRAKHRPLWKHNSGYLITRRTQPSAV